MAMTRREAWSGGLALGALALSGCGQAVDAKGPFPYRLSDAQWRRRLSPGAYAVLREAATEPPFSSPLDREQRKGRFDCAGCARPLFDAATKFKSGTGWPSFWRPLDGALGTSTDSRIGFTRTEVHCARCGGHLGHVFKDGPPPTGLRYCINGVALRFRPA